MLRSLLVFLFLLVSTLPIATAVAQPASDSGLTLNSFARPMLVSTLIKSFPQAKIDTVERLNPLNHQMTRTPRISPVTFYGTPATLELNATGDSLRSARIIIRAPGRSLKPADVRERELEIAEMLQILKRKCTSSYGDPSVMGETFFIYLGGGGVPAVNAQLKDLQISIAITPLTGQQ